MIKNMNFFKKLSGFGVLVFVLAIMTVRAQDSDQYREDYDRAQKIAKNNQPASRADQLVTFIKERSNMDSKIRDYANQLFEADVRKMNVQGQFADLKNVCERAVNVDPLFGQAYLYYGFALKNEKKYPEAMNAFAKAVLIQTLSSPKAKLELDALYKASHRGSLIGLDRVMSDARKELKKPK
jgi:tetratricopeptide (TPR) repeat protein